ncbi:uncharacterized protein LOC124919344 [Impatiens glandulifera]|uniref:uncharacterized protein LOC124919344 n=1 Tax=Impatiens glandulifera TaxID=253017 RepID=UPI001FB166FC|nr:uncharacterized protein LOC124919344 [Impatiens glandulifera]
MDSSSYSLTTIIFIMFGHRLFLNYAKTFQILLVLLLSTLLVHAACGPSNLLARNSHLSRELSLTGGTTNSTWLLDYGRFKLLNGRTVACSLTSQEESNDDSQMEKTVFQEDSLAPHIKVHPPLLDYGESFLYFTSSASLVVENTHSDSSIYIYEPFSTNSQFYSCNFSKLHLGPGEVASICIVFSPIWLGISSAHLILQTSAGGFIVHVKGVAIQSPYKIQPIEGLDISLANPFDETIYVEAVNAWISVSQGNTTLSTNLLCRVEEFQDSDGNGSENIVVNSPLISFRPHRNWDIGPGKREIIVELDYSYGYADKISGAFFIQLLKSSQGISDTIIIPLRTELGRKSVYVSLDTILPCDGRGTVIVSVALKNVARYLLRFIKIDVDGEGKRLFQLRYIGDLILYPGIVTQVAVVTFAPIQDSQSEVLNANACRFTLSTNDSNSPQIEVLCKDVIGICSGHSLDYKEENQHVEHVNMNLGLSGGIGQPSSLSMEITTFPDELVLKNWKSQGSSEGISILDSHEIVFPMVQVGSHHSMWITVKNPSQQPVIMQLILSPAEIIDECRFSDHLSSNNQVLSEFQTPRRYGFSLAESARKEAYVHPHETAVFGPVYFHPSSRCTWMSSALIRNNLSGVESISLRGFGGSFSLALLEESHPVQNLDFKFNWPIPHNTCFKPIQKELYAKNTGDIRLVVKRIEVSGAECRLDGFVVESCEGFALEPGESMKMAVSYKADFIGVMIQRDLELVMDSGMIVIPMKATLPLHMVNMCGQSVFWLRLKKISVSTFFVIFLAFWVSSVSVAKTSNSQKFRLSYFKVEETGNLTIKVVGKDKGRKRRKRKGIIELSSSQSGNSTPSSPLSPADSVLAVEGKNHFADKQQERDDKIPNNKPEPCSLVKKDKNRRFESSKPHVLSASATFPSSNRAAVDLSRFLASTSTIAPHARAPGSNLHDREISKKGENSKVEDKFRYDIWADHLFGLNISSGRLSSSSKGISGADQTRFNSFFVTGPQSLEETKSVSFYQDG